ncbi:MAG: DUF3488 domain-containing protein [Nitrospirae bacterium]|nr:DUF3488 domain-containing protein [Nitrospirota bacterium]
MLRNYNILTAVIALTGSLSLFISGEINPIFSFSPVLMIYGYFRLVKNKPQAPKWTINVLSITTLIIFLLDAFIASDDYLVSVANLTILFQAIKSFDLREPWDNLQVFFMSLLQLIITSEFTNSILFGGIFIVFLSSSVSAIILAHFIKTGSGEKIVLAKPMVFITLITFFLTTLLFISIPRIAGGFWGKGHKKGIKTAGFSERVDFGSFGTVKLDPTIVMRIELSGIERRDLYWRGMTLDYFNGVMWENTESERRLIYKREGFFTIKPYKKQNVTVQKIYLEPIDTEILFGLPSITAIETNSRIISVDGTNTIYIPMKKNKQFFYTAYSVDEPVYSGFIEKKYIQLPEGMGRISELARNITKGKTRTLDKVIAIEKHLKERYTYTLTVQKPPRGVNPIEDFLFRTKKGYCEHYATAMVLMLRSIGVPSRIVTGFYGGEINSYGGYLIVRQSNAHSWVEAVIDNKWQRFDPTPAISIEKPSIIILYLDTLKMQWNRYVVSFSSSDQRNILRLFAFTLKIPDMPDFRLRSIRDILALFLVAFIMSTIAFLIYKSLKREHYAYPTIQYLKAVKILKKKGIKVTDTMTSTEIKSIFVENSLKEKIEELITMYEEHRFGGKILTPDDKKRYRDLVREIELLK